MKNFRIYLSIITLIFSLSALCFIYIAYRNIEKAHELTVMEVNPVKPTSIVWNDETCKYRYIVNDPMFDYDSYTRNCRKVFEYDHKAGDTIIAKSGACVRLDYGFWEVFPHVATSTPPSVKEIEAKEQYDKDMKLCEQVRKEWCSKKEGKTLEELYSCKLHN